MNTNITKLTLIVIGISVLCLCICSGSISGIPSNDTEGTAIYLKGSNDTERTDTYIQGSNDSERTDTYIAYDNGGDGGNSGTVTTMPTISNTGTVTTMPTTSNTGTVTASTTPATSITQSDRTESSEIQEAEELPESTIQVDMTNIPAAGVSGMSREIFGIPVIWIAGLIGAIIIANVSVVLIMLWRQRQM